MLRDIVPTIFILFNYRVTLKNKFTPSAYPLLQHYFFLAPLKLAAVRRASWPELPAQGKADADRPAACSPSTARKGGVDADGPVARAPNAAGEEGAHGPAARRRSQRGWGGRAGRPAALP